MDMLEDDVRYVTICMKVLVCLVALLIVAQSTLTRNKVMHETELTESWSPINKVCTQACTANGWTVCGWGMKNCCKDINGQNNPCENKWWPPGQYCQNEQYTKVKVNC